MQISRFFSQFSEALRFVNRTYSNYYFQNPHFEKHHLQFHQQHISHSFQELQDFYFHELLIFRYQKILEPCLYQIQNLFHPILNYPHLLKLSYLLLSGLQ